EDFISENITFENSAPEGSGQAVTIRVTADRCAFYNCRFLGWQDTLYLHYGKQYLKDCYIEGSVDFIFGNSTAMLEHCHIHCKSGGYITAQSRKSCQETTGYVFLREILQKWGLLHWCTRGCLTNPIESRCRRWGHVLVVTALISVKWKEMSEEEKQKWNAEAAKAMEAYFGGHLS
ncbi:pectinesterase 31, partial [Tanacetum coccineum]